MPLARDGSVTLTASLVGYILFEVSEITGIDPMILKAISCNNETRPNADARRAVVWVGQSGSTTGDDSSDGIIASGYVSINGDLVEILPPNFELKNTEMIGFKFEGENSDVCNARILYEVKH